MRNLSGGNQQKVLLARWLITQPEILILDEPTRGIDIGAKAQIQAKVAELAAAGMSVVFISAELEEVLRLSDRLVVMRDRRKIDERPNVDVSVRDVLEIIAGEARTDGGSSCLRPRRSPNACSATPCSGRSSPWSPCSSINVVATPSFLDVRMQDGHLYGNVIDILRNSAPVMLVALGMTLVIATRGIDLSVGAIAAIAAAVACTRIVGAGDEGALTTAVMACDLRRRRLRRCSARGTASWSRCSASSRSSRR